MFIAIGCAVLLLFSLQAVTASDALPPATFAGPCSAWTPVNDGAFGMGTGNDGDYSNEEGFEVVVFDGRLYVGMEADNAYGARLWRTKAGVRVPTGQADWEEVAADANGWPFGNPNKEQNDHIDSLAVFQGALYASTANRSGFSPGTLIYSSTTGNPNSWTRVISAGFGDVNNVNFKDMRVFQDWLCGGTANDETGAEVWCTQDGAQWEQKNSSGFDVVSNTLIASTGVFSGGLYVGVVSDVISGSVWRTDDLATWTQVFTATDHHRVEIAAPFDGYLYVAAGAYDGRYGGGPLQLHRSATGDPGSWEEVGQAVGANVDNTRTIVDGATVYNGALYLATMNATDGTEVWRATNGVTWTQQNASGFGVTETFAAQLTTFNGYLYAWTSNYSTGQRVYRTACPICQTRTITGAGRYDFDGAGAHITLTAGLPEAITVCVRPGAPPTAQTTSLPVARAYHLAAAPATEPFTGDLTLHYTPEELAASEIVTATSIYLARWTGSTWEACPETGRARDVAARTVTCRNVSDFSTWAIAGEGGTPTRVRARAHTRATRPALGSWHGGLLLVLAYVAVHTWVTKSRPRILHE
ncbi:MAG: hypothetical protein ACP5J4_13515 [Anaerolineae bacterium]